MRLHLIRHAHAVNEEENPARPLSAQGRADLRRIVAFFQANQAIQVSKVWHSPLARSRETAQALAAALGPDAILVETPGLLSEDDPHKIAARLDALSSDQDLAVVGHEPHLSALATLLVRGKPTPVGFNLRKAAIISLARTDSVHKKTNRPRWEVRWHFSPELLPKL